MIHESHVCCSTIPFQPRLLLQQVETWSFEIQLDFTWQPFLTFIMTRSITRKYATRLNSYKVEKGDTKSIIGDYLVWIFGINLWYESLQRNRELWTRKLTATCSCANLLGTIRITSLIVRRMNITSTEIKTICWNKQPRSLISLIHLSLEASLGHALHTSSDT